MNIFALLLFIELGVIPRSDFLIYDPPAHVIKDLTFYVDMDAEFDLGPFFLGGGMKTYFWKDGNGYNAFWPNTGEFRGRAGIRFYPLSILEVTAGGRAYCYHPVIPYLYQENIKPKWEGAYSELFVRFKIECN